MTENDWLEGTDPTPMLEFMWGKATQRKLRLFAVACCRRIWTQMTDTRSRHAVDLAERSADEPVSDRELDLASGAAEGAYEDSLTNDEGKAVGDDDPRTAAAAAASYASSPGTLGPEHFSVVLEETAAASPVGADREKAAHAVLLRDLFGNPFRPARLNLTSLAGDGGLVVRLAQVAYEDRLLPSGLLDDARLAVLADALEEAGCSDAELLGHLREPGPHVRGCWLLDLLLAKE